MIRGSRGKLVVLLVVAVTYFSVRGPMRWIGRGDTRSNDLMGPYLSTRAWVQGLNPYSSDVFWRLLEDAGWEVAADERIDGYESRTPYPPPAFVMLAPLSAFTWATARLLALGVTLLVTGVAIGGLARLPAMRLAGRSMLFVALAMALSPLHSGIGGGNLVAAAAAFTVIGIWTAIRGWDTWAGVAVAFAMCLKPPIVLPVVLYYIVTRRWRVVSVAACVVASVLAVAVLRMQWAGVPWWLDYLYNNNILLAESGGSIILGPVEYRQFIHLQYLAFMLLGDMPGARTIALAVSGALLLAWLAIVTGRPAGRRLELLDVSALIVMSLLPFYHRVYDAALLLAPLCWLCIDRSRATVWPRRVAAVLMAPFFIPAVTFLEMQIDAGRISDSLASAWWWNAFVMTHQVWALLFMSGTLLVAMVLSRQASPATGAGAGGASHGRGVSGSGKGRMTSH